MWFLTKSIVIMYKCNRDLLEKHNLNQFNCFIKTNMKKTRIIKRLNKYKELAFIKKEKKRLDNLSFKLQKH